jgi:hypothetical protein
VTYPTPTRIDHEKFCRIEGWTKVRDARGRSTGHHVTYEFALPTGNVLRTRVSHPVDRTDYGPQLWGHILRDQLDVGEDQFWDCVRNRVLPPRGAPEAPPGSLPADLVYQLVVKFRVPEADVAALDKEAAVNLLRSLWLQGSAPPEGAGTQASRRMNDHTAAPMAATTQTRKTATPPQ